jgi:hypothetical protein
MQRVLLDDAHASDTIFVEQNLQRKRGRTTNEVGTNTRSLNLQRCFVDGVLHGGSYLLATRKQQEKHLFFYLDRAVGVSESTAEACRLARAKLRSIDRDRCHQQQRDQSPSNHRSKPTVAKLKGYVKIEKIIRLPWRGQCGRAAATRALCACCAAGCAKDCTGSPVCF